MKLEADAITHLFRERITIALLGTSISQECQIVGLELDAIELVDASEFLYFLHALIVWQWVFALFIGGKFAEEILLCIFLAPLFLCAETLGNGEERHDRVMVDAVDFYLIEHLQRVGERFWDVREDVVHLLTRLKPLLLGVEHAGRIVQVLTRREAEQMVVCLGILLIHKVTVVSANQFDAILFSQLDEHLVGTLLHGIGLSISALHGVLHLMALKLQIVVVSEYTLMPLDGFACASHIAI